MKQTYDEFVEEIARITVLARANKMKRDKYLTELNKSIKAFEKTIKPKVEKTKVDKTKGDK